MQFRFLRVLIVLIFSFQSLWVHSQTLAYKTSEPVIVKDKRQGFREFFKIYKTAKNLSGLVTALKYRLSPDEVQFLQKKIASLPDSPLPEISAGGEDEAIFSLKNESIRFKVISYTKKIYSINSKNIDFSSETSLEERWEKIQKAFPRQARLQPFMDLLLPPAYAFLPVIASGAFSVGSFVFGLFLANDYSCGQIREAADSCKKPLIKLNDLIKKFEETNAELIKNHKNPRVCPYVDVKSEAPKPEVKKPAPKADAKGKGKSKKEDDDKDKDKDEENDKEDEDKLKEALKEMQETRIEIIEIIDGIKRTMTLTSTQMTQLCSEPREKIESCFTAVREKAAKLCWKVEEDIKDLSKDPSKSTNKMSAPMSGGQ